MMVRDCTDIVRLYWLAVAGISRRPFETSLEGPRVASPAWAGLSRAVGPVWGTEIDNRAVCVCECVEVRGLGLGVNPPELGQMLLTSSSQVDSLRGKMASNPPGVRAFGLTHWEPSLSTAPSSQSPLHSLTHPLTNSLTALTRDTRKSHLTNFYCFFTSALSSTATMFSSLSERMWAPTDLFRDANGSLMMAVVGSPCLTQPQGMQSGKRFKGKHAATQEPASAHQLIACVYVSWK